MTQVYAQIPQALAGQRADKALAELFPQFSRTTIQRWLREGLILVDQELPGQRDRMQGGEQVEIVIPEAPSRDWVAQPIGLDIVQEDDQLIVINKPPGLVVHPGAGVPDGTLLNALLHHEPALAKLPRAGIVHRLDRDTSGLIVVARTEAARRSLIEQLSARTVKREYLALVCGTVISGGTVDEPIGRDPRDRRRMIITDRGKSAVTHYRVARRFRAHTLVRVSLETGRTHQIRAHLKWRGFPILGDPVYGGRLQVPPQASSVLLEILRSFQRQALHAGRLTLTHPRNHGEHTWACEPPQDMQKLVQALDKDARRFGES